jgi:hypothetical protein
VFIARSLRGAAIALAIAALALPSGAAPVSAATRADIFTVSVPVDATAASATVARDTARADGQKHAYQIMLERLTLARDRAKLPAPTDTILNQVVQGFEVANERRSSVHYLADYTFHFRINAVEQLLRDRGVPFAEIVSKPVIVLPVLESGGKPMLWDDPNPWRDAWSHGKPAHGLVPMTIPLGEVEDVTAIDAASADKGDDAHLQAIAANYDHADVLVTRATIHPDSKALDVSTTRFVPGSPGGEQTWVASYSANAGESNQDLLARAVAGTMGQVEEAWKQANMLDYTQTATLTATVPAGDLDTWLAVRQRLAATSAVQRTDVLSLDRHGARVTLHYAGSPTQLRTALAQNNLDLSGNDPDWVLQQSGMAHATSTPPQQ